MDMTVLHVELSALGGQQVYVSTVEMPPGPGGDIPQLIVRVTPCDVFESLAAEYGIDPEAEGGWETLFDLLFYGRAAAGQQTAEEQIEDPDHLFNAPTIEHAREAKLAQIRRFKGKGRLLGSPGVSEDRGLLGAATGLDNSGDEDPLEFIKRTAPMSLPHLQIKQEHTRRRRAAIRAARAGRNTREMVAEGTTARRAAPKVGDRESVEALASRLLGPPQVEPNQPPPADFTKGGTTG